MVDLKQHTVLPGLIDLHVHVENQSSPGTYLERFTMEPKRGSATSYLLPAAGPWPPGLPPCVTSAALA